MGDAARRCVIPTAVDLSGVIVGAAAVWTSAAPAPPLVLRTIVIHRQASDAAAPERAASPPAVQALAVRPRSRVSSAATDAPAPPRAAAVAAVSRDPAPAPRTSLHAAAS